MNRISYFLLTIAAAIYLFINGILGFTNSGKFLRDAGAFREMLGAIGIGGDLGNILGVVLSVCGIAAGIFLLLALFNVDVPITDVILLGFIVLWVVYIVFVDIIGPLGSNNKPNALSYLLQLSTHLMVLGTLMTSTKRFGYSR